MVEYALVLVGVVLLAAGAYRFLGSTSRTRADDGAVELGGGRSASEGARGAHQGNGTVGGGAARGSGGTAGDRTAGPGPRQGQGGGVTVSGAAGSDGPAAGSTGTGQGGAPGSGATEASGGAGAGGDTQVGGHVSASEKMSVGLGGNGGGGGPRRGPRGEADDELTLTKTMGAIFFGMGILAIAYSVFRGKKKAEPSEPKS